MGERIENGDYVREYYRVPAHKGARVLWRGQPGVIIGFDLAYPVVELEADPLEGDPERVTVHPTWELEYLDQAEQAREGRQDPPRPAPEERRTGPQAQKADPGEPGQEGVRRLRCEPPKEPGESDRPQAA